ncbi:hypothetical protein A6E15_16410 [Natrinema saccharevitans]|uniref:HVO-0234-like beta-propeller domain-containing protein n=1 Tax=Natrinema saccharevitans TaxID=301967 RepID=A0A1S8B0S4_9EURY|nr:hypothetical protein [Natrinema saccharevitans]OLZ42447.1 hypothetical protein A6E15_16410 [Natrinema saccharevitans]
MHSIEEKRVYGDREGAITAYVASATGVVRVRVAGDTVGEFGLCERRPARDVATTDEAVAIATDEDVRVARLEDGEDTETFAETGFGPAVAVGADGGELFAAAPDGRIARRPAGTEEWTDLEGEGVAAVRAIDGDLVGTDDGVYRVRDGGLDHAGLTDVRDVSAAGVPLAATAEGLYKLGNGWMPIREGPFDAVSADPRSEPGRLARAYAIAGEEIYGYAGDDEWRAIEDASEPIVDVGYGETTYAVTEAGTFLAAGEDGWRPHPIGVREVTGLAVR